jgi:acyl-homoserine lactone acylase PvdQ
MTRELIGAVTSFSLESALSLAFSADVYKAEAWQIRLAKTAPESEFARMLSGWNRRAEADSRAALAFYLFKTALGEDAASLEPPEHVSDGRIRAALRQAQDRLETEFPVDATYGTLFRIGRDGARRTWPVGGGSVMAAGMATPRAIAFERRGPVMLGRGGQAAVEVVLLSRPPKSVMALPLGESSQAASPHFDDQTRELFSASRAHATYFGERKELEKHSKERKELTFP